MNIAVLLKYKIFHKILKSEFNKNVLILAGGTAVAQAVPVLISPILTRLYTPEDFGAFAIFVSITSVISVISCGRYELAVMLPEKDEDAINVAAVAFLFNVFINALFFLFILFFGDWLLGVLNAKNLGCLMYLAPLSVFLTGTFSILNYTNNRFKLYKDISKANVYKALAGAVVQIVMGVLKFGATGLVSGQILSQLASNTKLFFNIKHLLRNVDKDKLKNMGIRYINFPKYSLWAGLLNTTGYQLVNVLIGTFYGQTQLGYYYLAFRVLGMPASFIGSSISQVFYKQAVDEKNKSGNCEITFKNTFKKLLIISIPIFVIMFLIVQPIFSIIFGNNWKTSGLYAMILTPMFAIRFISSVLSIITSIYQKLKLELLINFLLVTFPVILIFQKFEFKLFLIIYSLVLSIMYFLFLILYYKIPTSITKCDKGGV